MKRLVLCSLLAALLVLFTGCGGASDSGEAAPEQETTKAADLELTDSGYSVTEDNFIHWGAVVKNPDEVNAYEYPVITITAYDKNGEVLAAEEQTLMGIEPGEEQAFGSLVDANGEKPDKVEFGIENGNMVKASDTAIKSSDLEVSGTNEKEGEFGDTSYTGKVKNNSETDSESVGVVVLLKNKGKIVYGEVTYVDKLTAGKEKPFDLDIYDAPEHDEYVITALNWS